VNPLLNASPFHSSETWLLPKSETLCVIRYIDRPEGGEKASVKTCAEFLPSPELPATCPELPAPGPSGLPGTSGPRTFRPARNFRPSTLQATLGRANSLFSPDPARNLPGPSGLRNIRPPRNFRPPESRPAPTAPTLGLHRNLPGTSGARTFRPSPELPALPACSDSGPRPMYPFAHLDYIYSSPTYVLGLAKD
jgi:hypothetical protein